MSSPMIDTSIRPEPELDLFTEDEPVRAYDEVVAEDGSIREHWKPLLRCLHDLGPDFRKTLSNYRLEQMDLPD